LKTRNSRIDSTGMALHDLIVAAAVYEKAVTERLGQPVNLGGDQAGPNHRLAIGYVWFHSQVHEALKW
jgi:hypothetical protein